jgi:hypothetical protein
MKNSVNTLHADDPQHDDAGRQPEDRRVIAAHPAGACAPDRLSERRAATPGLAAWPSKPFPAGRSVAQRVTEQVEGQRGGEHEAGEG